MKIYTCMFCLLFSLVICFPVESAPLPDSWLTKLFPSSSNTNAQIANENYPYDTIQRWVAKSLGDEIPNMRDDLIRRKNEGQDVLSRHWNAWTTKDNWNVDSNYKIKQDSDPFEYSALDTLGLKRWFNN